MGGDVALEDAGVGRARVRTDGARRVQPRKSCWPATGKPPAWSRTTRPARPPNAGPSPSIYKGGDGGTARQHYGINRASLRDEFPLSGDRGPAHQNHIKTTARRRMVPPRRHGGLFVLLARRVSDRAHLVSRGVRHVRQILNPLRDIRHALNRRQVQAKCQRQRPTLALASVCAPQVP